MKSTVLEAYQKGASAAITELVEGTNSFVEYEIDPRLAKVVTELEQLAGARTGPVIDHGL